jgi:hypothetical protein
VKENEEVEWKGELLEREMGVKRLEIKEIGGLGWKGWPAMGAKVGFGAILEGEIKRRGSHSMEEGSTERVLSQ